MGFKKNNPGCNCCESCIICDGECGWTDVLGGPSSHGSPPGVVDITTSNTITLSDAEAATGVSEIYLESTFFSFDSGDELRLYFKYKDSTHYWFAQITVGASGTIEIYERDGGSETQRATVAFASDPETAYTLAVCYGDGRVKATETITGTKCTYTVATTIDDQLKAGVGVGTLTSFAEFNDFIYRYLESPEKPTCEPCPAIAQGCEICSDDFARSDGTDITTASDCGWSEASGSWSISSGTLITTSSDARAISSTSHPLGTANMRIRSLVSMPTSGDIARIITAYTDSTHYWYAEYKVGASGYIRIYQVNGGSPVQKKTLSVATTASNFYTLCVSITNANLLVVGLYNVSSVLQATLAWQGSFSGAQFGLGTGTITGTVTFDNFEATLTNDTDPCPACSVQRCTECDSDVTAASQMKVVFPADAQWGAGTYYLDYCGGESSSSGAGCYFIGATAISSGPFSGYFPFAKIDNSIALIGVMPPTESNPCGHPGWQSMDWDYEKDAYTIPCDSVDVSWPNVGTPGDDPCLVTFPA